MNSRSFNFHSDYSNPITLAANFLGDKFRRARPKFKKKKITERIFHHSLFKSSINHEVCHFPLLAMQ